MQRGVVFIRSLSWPLLLTVAGAAVAVTAVVAMGRNQGNEHPVAAARVPVPPAPPPARGNRSKAPVFAPAEPAPVEIVATLARARIRVGDRLPITFAIRNRSDRLVPVLPSLDNSDDGVRYPIIDIEIRNQRGQRLEAPRPAGCGWVNRLTIEDFHWLAPGQTFDLFGANGFAHHNLDWRPQARGRYTIKLSYDLRFSSIDDAALGFNKSPVIPDGVALVPLLPRGLYESPLIEIDVR